MVRRQLWRRWRTPLAAAAEGAADGIANLLLHPPAFAGPVRPEHGDPDVEPPVVLGVEEFPAEALGQPAADRGLRLGHLGMANLVTHGAVERLGARLDVAVAQLDVA